MLKVTAPFYVFFFILLLAGTGLAQEPAGRKIYPADESHLDPSFAEFKARLLEANRNAVW